MLKTSSSVVINFLFPCPSAGMEWDGERGARRLLKDGRGREMERGMERERGRRERDGEGWRGSER